MGRSGSGEVGVEKPSSSTGEWSRLQSKKNREKKNVNSRGLISKPFIELPRIQVSFGSLVHVETVLVPRESYINIGAHVYKGCW